MSDASCGKRFPVSGTVMLHNAPLRATLVSSAWCALAIEHAHIAR
jgi:hypothetical protein